MGATIYIDDINDLPEVFLSVQEDFDRLDFQPFLRNELGGIADFEADLFDRQVSPDGQAWPENAQRTIDRKGHRKVLRGLRQPPSPKRQGVTRKARFKPFRLSDSLTSKSMQSFGDAIREVVSDSRGAALSFGTTVEYSGFHDRGGGRLPKRQHVGINENYLDRMTERFADYVLAELKKG